MNDNFIYLKLNEHLKELQKHYPIENIFGIFMLEECGNGEDILTEAVVIPLFEEVCTKTAENIKYIGSIRVADIRIAYNATNQGYPELINALYTDYIIINPLYRHIYDNLFYPNRDKIKSAAATLQPAPELKIALMKMCRSCWNETSKVVRFIKQLTDAEKVALKTLTEQIGDEGLISQANLAAASGVSRFTVGNLIMKMKFFDVALVEYQGNQGTYIKIIDDTLLDIKAEVMK